MAATRATIADFGLTRTSQRAFVDERLEFLTPFIGEITAQNWQFFKVTDPANPSGNPTFTYAVCVTKGVFLLFEAFLTNEMHPESDEYERWTEMRMWQLMLDCWAHAAGKETKNLRYVAVHDIVNQHARKCIRTEINAQISQGSSQTPGLGRVTVGPESLTWTQNIFTRAAVRMVSALTNKTVTRSTVDSIEDELSPFGGWGYDRSISDVPSCIMSMVMAVADNLRPDSACGFGQSTPVQEESGTSGSSS